MRFLFACGLRQGLFQPLQNGRSIPLGHGLLRMRLGPSSVQIELQVQLHQPRRLCGQVRFIREGLADLGLCRRLLLIKVIKLGFHGGQAFRHFRQGIVDAGEVAAGVIAQLYTVGHLPLQRQDISLGEAAELHGHGEAAIGAYVHGINGFDLLGGVDQSGTGVFLVGEIVAPDGHTYKALLGQRVGLQRFQNRSHFRFCRTVE